MTEENAKFIKEAYDYMGEECEIRSDYSGRGMYNRTTFGVILENPVDMTAILIEYIREALIGGEEDLYDTLPEFPKLNWDNMANRYIVY